MSVDRDSKVVGYVSYKPGRGMFCVGEDHACLVTGSVAEIRKRSKVRGAQILKARFGEIVFAIELGGPMHLICRPIGAFTHWRKRQRNRGTYPIRIPCAWNSCM